MFKVALVHFIGHVERQDRFSVIINSFENLHQLTVINQLELPEVSAAVSIKWDEL